MKIIHLCLSNFYIDGFSYQENELVAQNVLDGHDVLVIASTETFVDNMKLGNSLQPGSYMGSDGARVIRLPYRKGPNFLMKKLRAHPGVYDLLEREKPDVILFHGLCGWELRTAVKYKKNNPWVKLYADSHEDFDNSARNFISKNLLHRLYYKPIIRAALPGIDRIWCVSMDSINFVHGFYGIPRDRIEFFPLGGHTLSDVEYEKIRAATRKKYAITDEQILIVQSGKMDKLKKLNRSLLEFIKTGSMNLRFMIAGSLHADVKAEAMTLIARDNRISYIGWKSSAELRDLLCAADVYLQPGSKSVTMMMAMCCRCAVIVADIPSNLPFVQENGWILHDDEILEEIFSALEKTDIEAMKNTSANIASDMFDYRKLAAKLYA